MTKTKGAENTYIIIPVYNESGVIADVVKEVRKHFKNVVCINDGSADDSSNEINKAGATLVEHPINLGQGATIQTGVDFALQDQTAQYFVTFDGDGQHSIDDVIKMLDYLVDNDLDIVVGSRFSGTALNISPSKRALLRLAAVYSGRTTGLRLSDPYNGLRVFNRRFAENLKLTLADYSHPTEVAHRIAEGDYRYAEVPVTITYTDFSKADGQPMLNAVNISIDLLFHRITKK
jgi:polyprenyl-phospho-N-acetylgalactosaminyl synthase